MPDLRDRANALRKKVSQFFAVTKDMAEKIELVDTVEHLGIRHHFEDEIADALRNSQHMELNSSNLHEVSLRFRLLREHGLCVSPGIWDEKAVCLLPDYLKKFYLRIIISFKEIEDMLQPHEKYKVSYAKESFET
nr:unnamed protein product [Digitaria exilis]